MSPAAAQAADGAVYIYLQPLPRQADRLSFSIGAVSALGPNGTDLPLKVALRNVSNREAGRQRLLASGPLSEGGYSGLSVRIAKASVAREGGKADLLVPDAGLQVSAPFVVTRGKAVVLWVVLGDADWSGESTFVPQFSGQIAPRPIVSRAGFVSNARANWLTIFDKQLRQAVGAIPLAGNPSGMALDRVGGRLYVACPGDDAIRAIDVATNEVVEQSRVPAGDRPRELALTGDGRMLLSVNTGSNTLSLFDASPLTRIERVPVGSGPASLVLDPSGRRAFVFNTLSSSISVVDIERRSVTATIATESAPLRGQFSARGDRLFVIHERSPYVTVVDTVSMTVVTRVRLRSSMGAIKVDARRNLVYIGGPGDNDIQFCDPTTLLPIDAMRTSGGVMYLALDVEDNSLYAVNADAPTVMIGNVATRKRVAEIDVGEGPYWVVVAGEE